MCPEVVSSSIVRRPGSAWTDALGIARMGVEIGHNPCAFYLPAPSDIHYLENIRRGLRRVGSNQSLGALLSWLSIAMVLWAKSFISCQLDAPISGQLLLSLPLAIHASVLSYYYWNVCIMFAMGSMNFLGSSTYLVLKRLSARSTIPVISMLFLCKSLLNGCDQPLWTGYVL